MALDKPFYLLETSQPQPSFIVDSNIESWNSWFKILMADIDSGYDQREFSFYFLWFNESHQDAVVNVSTSVMPRGFCQAVSGSSDYPLIPGDQVGGMVSAFLYLWETWNEPYTQPGFQSSQVSDLVQCNAQGGDLFDALQGKQGMDLVSINNPLDVDFVLFRIPARATAIFEVSFEIEYNFITWDDVGTAGGPDTTDSFTADFASDNFGGQVLCPWVLLEIVA